MSKGCGASGSLSEKQEKVLLYRVYLKPEQWDTARCVVKKHLNADALNRWIQQYATEIEKKELDMWRQGKRILWVVERQRGGNSNPASFSFLQTEVENSMLKNSSKDNHLSYACTTGGSLKGSLLCRPDFRVYHLVRMLPALQRLPHQHDSQAHETSEAAVI